MSHNDAFDPTAPEADSGGARNAYMSKRDLRVIGIGLVVLFALLIPVYQTMLRRTQKSQCIQSMQDIIKAVNLYAEGKDDRLPPVYRTGPGFEPGLGPNGLPFTWAADVVGFTNGRSKFTCPSAKPDEIAQTEDPLESAKVLAMTYGMYLPYGGFARSSVADPSGTVLIAETSNYGAADSYNPVPFSDGAGNSVKNDAFAITWNSSNERVDPKATQWVTRLAFPGTSGGKFEELGASRHDGGIHALSIDGGKIMLKPNQARVSFRDGVPDGYWAVPPSRLQNAIEK